MKKDTKDLERGDIIEFHGKRWIVTSPNSVGGAGFKTISEDKMSEVFHYFMNVEEVEFISNAFKMKHEEEKKNDTGITFLNKRGVPYKNQHLAMEGTRSGNIFAYTTVVEIEGTKYVIAVGYVNTGGEYGYQHDYDRIVCWYRPFITRSVPMIDFIEQRSFEIDDLPEHIRSIAERLVDQIESNGLNVATGVHKGYVMII